MSDWLRAGLDWLETCGDGGFLGMVPAYAKGLSGAVSVRGQGRYDLSHLPVVSVSTARSVRRLLNL